MNESRKRRRLDDDDYGVQVKYFVNRQMVEKSDASKMKGVYEKTLNMIFAGAKIQSKNFHSELSKNENPRSPVLDTIDDKLPKSSSIGCQLCWNDVESITNYVCKNCNLKMCSNCHTNCQGCQAKLCSNCVKIFGCCLGDDPICEDCKFFAQ